MFVRTSLACLTLASGLWSQGTERLSLEALAHPTLKKSYVGMPATRLEWLPDGALMQVKREKDQAALLRVDPATWEAKPLLEAARLQAALVAAGATEPDAKAALGRGAFTWNEGRSAFLVEVKDGLFLVDVKAATAKRLAEGHPDEPSFSPDGAQVAYLRGNDLYRVDVATAKETRLTTGGNETVFNGRLDWVYQEEVYGRGRFGAFWWSPDSKRIAYLSFDETKVPVFTLADDRSQPQKLLQARYPKVGDPNPIARLGIVDLQGHTTWTPEAHPGLETLITRVTWDPKGRLIANLTDRAQTWLELRRFEGTGSTVLVKEQGRAWVDAERQELPLYLKDGGFLWQSNRTGYQHIYRYDAEGKLKNAVTSGTWDVRHLHGVNEAKGLVYFDATEHSPIATHTYRTGLDGKGLTRLTQARGTHRVRWNAAFSAYLDTWSSLEQPARQALFDGAGKQLRLIDENPSPLLKSLKLGTVKQQQVKTRDGFPMETLLILPPDFDATKKYPVYQHIYGGPQAPQVNDAWGRELLWWHFLAQNGYVVWICDNRSASHKGQISAEGIYKHLGAQELEDQLDGLKWLGEQGFADLNRVCIEGWSYGGYMSAYAMTHSKAYKLGIIGAPVTNYRLYDSIYTERYMGLLADNQAGYDGTNLAAAAKDFSGKGLIMHGLTDDNVHPQNTVQLIEALMKAGKDFDLRLYPGSDHVSAFGKPWQYWDIMKARWAFVSKNL
ncbi:MAG TPA: S9 family peptidase [Geothrix sp.]|nr:S9 family peptidase [Geothrix sp.]